VYKCSFILLSFCYLLAKMQPKREAQMATSQAAKKSRTTAERKESTPTASEQKKLKRTSQVSQVRFTSAGLFA
jgi:hypothetical protein